MTTMLNQSWRLGYADTRELQRSRRLFLLARAQLAAGRTEPSRLDAARRKWRSQGRRFS